MLINLKDPIKDLKGRAIMNEEKQEFTVGEALSNVLISSKEGGKMKLYTLAQKCYNDTKLEVDEADSALIKSTVKKSELYSALVLGQLELLLEKSESVKDTE